MFTCTAKTHSYRPLAQRRVAGIAAAIAFVISLAATSVNGQTFTEVSTPFTGLATGVAAWSDYDNDGDLDVLLTGYVSSTKSITRIYRNNSGNFVAADTSLIGASFSSAWGDYDNDGDLDLFLAGSNGTKLYENVGGSFVDTRASLSSLKAGSASWGDYNNDGTLDLALTGYVGNPPAATDYSVLYHNIKGVFVYDFTSNLYGVYESSIAWGDYDNDGDLDFLLTGDTSHLVGASFSSLYRNRAGVLSKDSTNSVTSVSSSSVAWGDYDSDGDLDILLTGGNYWPGGGSGPQAIVYRNEGSRFNQRYFPDLQGVTQSAAAWGDYDNDGDLDILIIGYETPGPVGKIYRNTGTGFTVASAGLIGVRDGAVAWGDYDNDGDLDILMTGMDALSNRIAKLYRNDSAVRNISPLPPSNLTSIVAGDTVTLNWDKSTDTETPSNGLTYNLRIGITPGGTQIVSPMANASTGFRKLPQLGNTNLNNSWFIKDLAPGTYYWSVQAIDNAFAGSAFAPEQSFTINGAGRALAINDAVAAPGETLAIAIRVTDASSIAGAELKITFDPNLLTALDATTTALTSGFTLVDTISSGKIVIVMARANGITSGSGDFLNLVFRVNPNAALNDSTTLAFTHVALYDENTQAIPVTTVDGVFRVTNVPQLASLALSPDSVIVESDSAQVFTAVGRDGGGNPITINPTWSLSGDIGELAPLAGDTTTFTAKKYGEGFIYVRQGALFDSTALAVRLRCDINNDLLVDVRDVIICLRMIVGLPLPPLSPGHTIPTRYERWAANANRDLNLNMADAYLILLKAIGRLLPKASAQASHNTVALNWSMNKAQTDELIIPITVQGGAAIHAASLTLLYDATALALEEIAPSLDNSLWIANTNESGKIRMALLNAEGLLDGQEELLRLRFKVVQTGNAHIPFSITQAELFDAHAQPLEVLLTQGEPSSPPQNFALLQNYPNPFNPETTIGFDLPRESEVRLEIYNVHGQLLRTLFEGALKAGAWQRVWEGRDADGNEVPSGVYFYRLQVNGGEWSSTRKMILMR